MGQISNRCKVNLPQNAKASSTPFHGPICLLWLFCLFVSPFGYWIICNKWRFPIWVHHSLMWISPSTVKLGKIKRGAGGVVGEIESFKNCRPNWLIDFFFKTSLKILSCIYQSPRGLHARTNKNKSTIYKRITCILYPTIFKRVGEKTNSKLPHFSNSFQLVVEI